jgi:hypothetical protein
MERQINDFFFFFLSQVVCSLRLFVPFGRSSPRPLPAADTKPARREDEVPPYATGARSHVDPARPRQPLSLVTPPGRVKRSGTTSSCPSGRTPKSYEPRKAHHGQYGGREGSLVAQWAVVRPRPDDRRAWEQRNQADAPTLGRPGSHRGRAATMGVFSEAGAHDSWRFTSASCDRPSRAGHARTTSRWTKPTDALTLRQYQFVVEDGWPYGLWRGIADTPDRSRHKGQQLLAAGLYPTSKTAAEWKAPARGRVGAMVVVPRPSASTHCLLLHAAP